MKNQKIIIPMSDSEKLKKILLRLEHRDDLITYSDRGRCFLRRDPSGNVNIHNYSILFSKKVLQLFHEKYPRISTFIWFNMCTVELGDPIGYLYGKMFELGS